MRKKFGSMNINSCRKLGHSVIVISDSMPFYYATVYLRYDIDAWHQLLLTYDTTLLW